MFGHWALLCSVVLLSTHWSIGTEVQTVETCLANPATDDVASTIIQEIYTKVKEGECGVANPSEYPAHCEIEDGEEFDFIVVGAGSAGAVIANRLSEVESWDVLLIEAGGNPTKTSEVPAMLVTMQGTSVDWQHSTEPEETNCLGMKNNTCNWPRGKTLGGSSTINANLYVRGIPKNFDYWAEQGNTGWDYESVLPYFKKSEDMKAEDILKTKDFAKYHSTGGYLSVDTWDDKEIKPLVKAYSKGMKEMGYKSHPDVNSNTHVGFTRLQGTIVDGRRCSTAKAFLGPAKDRSNLKVSKNSHATRLLIDEETKTVQGVEFLNEQGDLVQVNAKKEVIVSGGAINSPQLLMLSGIGPKNHLEELNIEVVQDLPVGESLFEHALMTGMVLSFNYTRPVKTASEYMFDFLTTNSSKFSNVGMLSYCEFINTVDKTVNDPDIQIHHFDFDENDSTNIASVMSFFGFKDEIAQQFYEINTNRYIVMSLATLLQPKSSGKILLASTDPLEHPKITSGILSAEEDIETYLRTIDFVEKFAKTESLKKFDAKFHEISPPDCEVYAAGSRDFRICALKHMIATTFHPTSTCKMGSVNDPSSVVDHTLRVIGVNGLRVADASIMPYIVSANTNAACIMIGEKASDLIKESWL